MFPFQFSLSLYFLIFFFISPHLALAWNSTCYSPVQMASLLSKPKKSGPSLRKIKGQISGVDRAIDRVQEKLDEEIGRLADSLDRQKLGMDPGSVADEIAAYMESKQDGWDCSSGGNATLVPQLFFILKQKLPILLKQLEYIFIPLALAAKDGEGKGLRGEDKDDEIDFVEIIPEDAPSVNKERDCKALGNGFVWKDNKCVCSEKTPNRVAADRCEACGEDKPKWDGKSCVCPSDTHVKRKGKCRERTNEDRCNEKAGQGFVWKGNECVCSEKTPNRVAADRCEACGEDKPKWDGKSCVCPSDTHVKRKGKCRERTNEDRCNEKAGQGFVWKGNECVCSEKTPNRVAADRCEACGEDKPKWDGKSCVCPSDTHVKRKGKCRKKISKEKCEERGGGWKLNANGKCECPSKTHVTENNECRLKKGSEKCEGNTPLWDNDSQKCIDCPAGKPKWDSKSKSCEACPSGQIFKNGQCDCPDWKKDEAFGNNGKVSNRFCDKYASNKADCRKALSAIKRHLNRLAKLERQKERLENLESKQEMAALTKSTSETEATGLCFDCLKRTLAASRPSTGQQIGNVLTALTGVGLGLVGYNIGRRAQMDANTLRIRDGLEAQNDYYSFMGAGAGFPYLAGGLYGMTRVNAPTGGWSCSPTVGYGYPQHGQGFNMRYY